jgi:hypothetical protein
VYIAASTTTTHIQYTLNNQMQKTQASGDGILFHRKFASPFETSTTVISLCAGEKGGTAPCFLHKDKQKASPVSYRSLQSFKVDEIAATLARNLQDEADSYCLQGEAFFTHKNTRWFKYDRD